MSAGRTARGLPKDVQILRAADDAGEMNEKRPARRSGPPTVAKEKEENEKACGRFGGWRGAAYLLLLFFTGLAER